MNDHNEEAVRAAMPIRLIPIKIDRRVLILIKRSDLTNNPSKRFIIGLFFQLSRHVAIYPMN